MSEHDATQAQSTEGAAEAKAQSSRGQPKVPGYTLKAQLGSGSFGEVWAAVQESTGQDVAIKLLYCERLSQTYQGREVDRLRSVSEHPHIVTLLDADLEASPPYLVMALMRDSLANQESSSFEDVRRWFQQTCEALTFTHKRGILHCDLKPSNLLTDGEGNVRLADFGQAVTVDQDTGALGSLGFMAPEQAESPDQPTVGWDIYGIGATTYRLLTGATPRLDNADLKSLAEIPDTGARLRRYSETLRANILKPVRELNPSVDIEFAAIIERSLQLDPKERTGAANVLLEDLGRRVRHEPLLSRRPWSRGYLLQRFLRRHLLGTVVLVLLGLALSGLGLVKYQDDRQVRGMLATQNRATARSLTDSGYGQEGLLWSAEALTHSPHSLAPRFEVEHFRPVLEQVYAHGSPPDTVGFLENSRVFACSDSDFRVWKEGTVTLHEEAKSVHKATLQKPYFRSSPRALEGGPLAVLSERLLRWDGARSHTILKGDLRLLGSGGGTVVYERSGKLYAHDGESQQELPTTLSMTRAAVSPDGRLVAGYSGRTVLLWNPKVQTLEASAEINHLSFDQTGERLAVSCYDGSVQVYELTDLENPTILDCGRWPVYSAFFRPGKQQIFTCDYSGAIRVWEGPRYRDTGLRFEHRWLVYGVSFDTDGRTFVSYSTDGEARVWNADSGEPITPFLEHGSPVRTAKLDSDRERLVTGSLDGTVRVYRLFHGLPRETLYTHEELAITYAQFLGDKPEILAAFGDVNLAGSTLSSQTPSHSGAGQAKVLGGDASKNWGLPTKVPINTVAHSPQKEIVAMGGQDGTLTLLDSSGNPQSSLEYNAAIAHLSFSPDGSRLVACFYRGDAVLCKVDQGLEELVRLKHEGRQRTSQTTHPVYAEFNPSGRSLVTALGDEQVRIWDANDGNLLKSVELKAPARRAVFSRDGKRLATVSDDGTARLWTSDGNTQVGAVMEHKIGIWDASFSPDGQQLATASGDSTCRVWSAKTGLPLFSPLQHAAPVVRVKFGPNGKWLLSGAKDGTANLWDAQTGELVTRLLKAKAPVFSLDFSADGQTALAAAGDGSLGRSDLTIEQGRSVLEIKRLAQKKTGLRLHFSANGTPEFEVLTAQEWAEL